MKHILVVVLTTLFALQSSADFIADCLTAHNAYRTPLNIAGLTWSADIAKSAQAWAENLAALESLKHSSSSYGENLACRTGEYVDDSEPSSTTSSSTSSSSNTQNSNQGATTNSGTSSSSSQNTNVNSNQNTNSNSNTQSSNNNSNNQNSNSNSNNSRRNSKSNNQNSNNNGRTSSNQGGSNDSGDNSNNGWNSQSNGNSRNNRNSNNGNSNANNSTDNSAPTGSSNRNSRRRSNDGGNGDNYNSGRYLAGSSSTSLINALIGQWGSEKQYFVYGTFPDVSNGDKTIGHYTQMIWGETKQVGCGIANNDGGWVYFVCQYYPAGNMDGDQVY